MKRLILLILGGIPAILLAANLSIPVSDTAYKNPNLHQAIYVLMGDDTCDGLITDLKGSDVIVVNPKTDIGLPVTVVDFDADAVDAELVTIDSQIYYNNLIQTNMVNQSRQQTITNLKAQGLLPLNYSGN
jgi:hypothetical protein